MTQKNPLMNALHEFGSLSFSPFNQDDYLAKDTVGICLPISFDWVKYFFAPHLSTRSLLNSLKSTEVATEFQQTQAKIGSIQPAYSNVFKSKLTTLTQDAGLSAQGATLTEPKPLLDKKAREAYVAELIEKLLTQNGAVFIFLYNRTKTDNVGHTIVLTSQLLNHAAIQLGFFDPSIGEATCTYHESDMDLIKNRLYSDLMISQDVMLPVASKTYYEWIHRILDFYADHDCYDTMKFYQAACTTTLALPNIQSSPVAAQFLQQIYTALVPIPTPSTSIAILDSPATNTPTATSTKFGVLFGEHQNNKPYQEKNRMLQAEKESASSLIPFRAP